jgi:hypothetical protein
MPPRWPAVIPPAPPPGPGRHAPGDSPHPSAPTGQPPPCCVTPNTPSPTGQSSCCVTSNTPSPTGQSCRVTSPTGQFPLPCCICLLSRLLPPLAAAPPTHHQGHPANWRTLLPPAGAPLEGEPLWHHRATRGLPGVGYPPGARLSTTPAQAGVVHNRPRDTPCRRRAPALTLRAGQHPAVPAAHPPPVRERRAPCPVRLAQSCLSTYPPTPFGSQVVKVV